MSAIENRVTIQLVGQENFENHTLCHNAVMFGISINEFVHLLVKENKGLKEGWANCEQNKPIPYPIAFQNPPKTKIEVTGCHDCPLYQSCNLGNTEKLKSWGNKTMPVQCPLREKDFLVTTPNLSKPAIDKLNQIKSSQLPKKQSDNEFDQPRLIPPASQSQRGRYELRNLQGCR